MCMIAHRPAHGSNIPNAVIDTALSRHPDGFGVSWRRDGQLFTERYSPKERAAFRTALKEIDRSGAEYVAHFRFATHGPKDKQHAHPYEYTDPEGTRILVFHNGVIQVPTTAQESDTEVFVRDIMAKLPPRWWEDAGLRYLVDAAIGWSKLVLMTPTETVNLHERKGETDGGIWYSSDHRPFVYTSRAPAKRDQNGWPLVATAKAAINATTSMFRDEDDDEDDREEERYIAQDVRWVHLGHKVTPTQHIERDGPDNAYEDAVVCDSCQTVGDVYVMNGKTFIDMQHLTGVSTADHHVKFRRIAAKRGGGKRR